MEELVLRNFETFSEIPEGLLLVKENCNLMYVRISGSAFIAREFVESISTDDNSIKYKISYLEVVNNKNILNLEIKKVLSTNKIEVINKKEYVDVIPLSDILNISGNNCTYISLDDVDNIAGYKEEFIQGKKRSII